MNAELIERIKEEVGPRAFLDVGVLKSAMLGAAAALKFVAELAEEEASEDQDHADEFKRFAERIRAKGA